MILCQSFAASRAAKPPHIWRNAARRSILFDRSWQAARATKQPTSSRTLGHNQWPRNRWEHNLNSKNGPHYSNISNITHGNRTGSKNCTHAMTTANQGASRMNGIHELKDLAKAVQSSNPFTIIATDAARHPCQNCCETEQFQILPVGRLGLACSWNYATLPIDKTCCIS